MGQRADVKVGQFYRHHKLHRVILSWHPRRPRETGNSLRTGEAGGGCAHIRKAASITQSDIKRDILIITAVRI